jgi:hypothetical protein
MSTDNISSAEMTALWRSAYPNISSDSLSKKMASIEGHQKAKDFEDRYKFPLVSRAVSTRAGWFLNEAFRLLKTGEYDTCISFGSGFSLLTYYIAKHINHTYDISFYDIDLPNILLLRQERIEKIKSSLDDSIYNKIQNSALNLEDACRSGKAFSDLLPMTKAPLVMLEGIIYFLSKECVAWIFNGLNQYKHAGILFDYWPETAPSLSACFRRVMGSLNDFIPEQIQGLISDEYLKKLCGNMFLNVINLDAVEDAYAPQVDECAMLINQDEYIPVKLATATTTSANFLR